MMGNQQIEIEDAPLERQTLGKKHTKMIFKWGQFEQDFDANGNRSKIGASRSAFAWWLAICSIIIYGNHL